MAFHHLAFATRDLTATHAFYTDVMGFDLVKVEAAPTPGGGWARHVFYDTGAGMIAFWDLHDDPEVPADFDTAISTGLGLPAWVNHVAFDAPERDQLDERRRRWLEAGHDVVEIDHGWCTSLYTLDPNRILVEWCMSTRAFTDADRDEAHRLLHADRPELDTTPPGVIFHEAAASQAASTPV